MKTIYITNSFEETQALGMDLAGKIKEKRVLALYGDLGSGKTTFLQGFAKGLGIEKKIISPTFIIMRNYKIPQTQKAKIKEFYHVDLYRVRDESDLVDLGILELMQNPQNLFAIEWPEKIQTRLSKGRMSISFEYLDDNKRKISIEAK